MVSEADGYSFTTLNGNLLAFNETTAIIISASRTSQTEAAKEAITKLMKQTADNSIAKSGAFQKIAKQKSDINFFASMSAIPSTYRSQISMGLPSEIKPEYPGEHTDQHHLLDAEMSQEEWYSENK